MKSFRKEKGRECVFVTLDSIAMLYYVDDNMPKSIFSKLLKEPSVMNNCNGIDEENKNRYVKFSKKSEVEYFKNINWIYDFEKCLEMSESELESKFKGISDVLEALKEKRKIDKNNQVLKAECIKKQYELESIKILLNIKSNMPEPEYISPDKFHLLKKGDNIHITREGAVYKYPKLVR